MGLGGAFLKGFQTFLYAVEFCCAAIILGIFSYFLAFLADRKDDGATISNQSKAIEGISGAGVLYTIFAVILTCCLGGKAFFGFIAMMLNVLFCGGFIAIAVLTRNGTQNCNPRSGQINTPIGWGEPNNGARFSSNTQGTQITYGVKYKNACRLEKASFAVAVAGAVLFFLSVFTQLALVRHHKKEKRFGPGPANDYTHGTHGGNKKFWQRRKAKKNVPADPEMTAAVPATGTTTNHTLTPGARDYRPSHDTAYTGTTAQSASYDAPQKPLVGGYHTAPTGTYNATPATNY